MSLFKSGEFDAKNLLKDYKHGLGYKPGDLLKPREGSNPHTYGAIDDTVVVLRQSALSPITYKVVGENPNPNKPSDRFINFEINGHDWYKVGRA